MTDAVNGNATPEEETTNDLPVQDTPATPAPIALDDGPADDDEGLADQSPQTAHTDAEGVTTYSFEPTGDAGLDVALDFVGKLGFSLEHPAMVKAGEGDFNDLRVELAKLGDKAAGWEKMVALATQAYERKTAEANQAADAIEQSVLKTVGGAEAWSEIQAWASANADPKEKAEINAMLRAGPVQARAAAQLLMQAYNQAGGTVVTPAAAARNAGANTRAAAGPLSPREYLSAVDELYAKLGSRMDDSAEYAALRARAAAFRG